MGEGLLMILSNHPGAIWWRRFPMSARIFVSSDMKSLPHATISPRLIYAEGPSGRMLAAQPFSTPSGGRRGCNGAGTIIDPAVRPWRTNGFALVLIRRNHAAQGA